MAKSKNTSITIQPTSGNSPSVFDFKGDTVRVITDESGEPWFIAKDVCDVLGIRTDTIRKILEADEVAETNPNIIGVAGGHNPLIVNEPGLYRLTLKSRKSAAKAFQRWVTHEVLPAIRKTGMYATPDTVDRILDNPDVMIGILQRYKEAKEENTRQAAQLEAQKPKVEAYDDFMDSTGLLLVRDTVKLLSKNGVKVKEKELRQMMVAWGWAYREETTHSWRPTAYGIERGYLALVPPHSHGTHSDGSRLDYQPTMKLTRKGFDRARVKLHGIVGVETIIGPDHQPHDVALVDEAQLD